MTYTHLTTNEPVMIETYYQEALKVSDIATSLGRSKQTIYNVINYLKEGNSAYDYYERYKINKKRCGRNKTNLTQSENKFIQTHLEQNWSLDIIKGTFLGEESQMGGKKRVENKLFVEICVREQTVTTILKRTSVI